MSSPREIKSLTGLRGLSALWVVFIHYFGFINFQESTFLSLLSHFRYNGNVPVDIFFILSAWVLCLAYEPVFSSEIKFKSYIKYLKRRFIRIYPAFLFWMLAFVLIFDLIQGKLPILKILANLFLIHNFFEGTVISSVFWTLSSEWVLYLLFPFLLKYFFRIKSAWILCLILGVCLIFYQILPSLNNFALDSHLRLIKLNKNNFTGVTHGFNAVLRCLLSYCLGVCGYLLCKSHRKFFWSRRALYWLYRFSLIGFVLVIPVLGHSDFVYVLLIGFSFMLIWSLFGLKQHKTLFNSRILYYLGNLSYSMYLSHMFILIALSILVKKIGGGEVLDNFHNVVVFTALAVTFLVSYLSRKYIELKGGALLRAALFKTRQVFTSKYRFT